MAKVANPEPAALAALTELLGAPAPRMLHGAKGARGIFAGASAAEKAAARHCIDQGWLVPTGDAIGKGKTRKELYRIAPAGLQAVLGRSDPSTILRSLAENLKRQDDQAADIPQAVQAASASIERKFAALTAELQKSVAEVLGPLASIPASLKELQTVLARTLEKIKPLDMHELSKKLAAPGPSGDHPARADTSWTADVVRMAAEQKQRNAFQRLTLPQVFERLRAKYPGLTLGQFHDGLRRMQDEKQIRLGPYTQALATLDDPRNALFLDREVKFYVELP